MIEDIARKNILALMEKKGDGSRADLGRHLGVNRTMVTYLLNGSEKPASQRRKLTLHYLEGIAGYLGVTVTELIKE